MNWKRETPSPPKPGSAGGSAFPRLPEDAPLRKCANCAAAAAAMAECYFKACGFREGCPPQDECEKK